jgi:hypothetical protein
MAFVFLQGFGILKVVLQNSTWMTMKHLKSGQVSTTKQITTSSAPCLIPVITSLAADNQAKMEHKDVPLFYRYLIYL